MSGLLDLVSSHSQEVRQKAVRRLTGSQTPVARRLPRLQRCTDPCYFSMDHWQGYGDQSRLLWQALQVNVRLPRDISPLVFIPDPFKTLCAHP